MQRHGVEVRPLTGGMGAELGGVDLSRALDEQTFGAIHRALLEYGVIFFRRQNITPAQQLAFAGRWGEVHLHPHMRCLPGHPGLIEIVKRENDTTVFGENWHTDQMFTATPARVTVLHAKEVPPVGGDTLFANLHAAYDALSEGMRSFLETLRTVSAYDTQKTRPAAMTPTALDTAALVEHPLVRTHPETGRKALYVNVAHTARFVGMTDEESAPLLDFLFRHQVRPEFTCRFSWRVGSLALWDNRCAQHNPVNDYHGHRRVMHRITLAGDRPR